MKTSVIEVHDMLTVFSVDEVEKRIGEVPGVESVTVNFAAGNATARYDETRLEIADIKSAVRQRGFDAPDSAPAATAAFAPAPAPEMTSAPPETAPATAATAPSDPAAHEGHEMAAPDKGP